MKRIFLLATFSISAFCSFSQVTYDFSADPFSNGWNFYDTYNGSGFTYASGSQAVSYQLTTSTEVSVLHKTLPYMLNENFCVSFKITPASSQNYNAFFPLLLAPEEQTGNMHPWRQDPQGGTAGPMQTMDLIGVFGSGNELRFVYRNNATYTIIPMSPAFNMSSGVSYWIKLSQHNFTSVTLSVYSDAGMTSQLATTSYVIPQLDAFNDLYIANCNGNTETDQYGLLDDYVINGCDDMNLGVKDNSEADFNLYPNPATQKVTIDAGNLGNVKEIQLLSESGQIIRTIDVSASSDSHELSLANVASGVYLVGISSDEGQRFKPLVKL